MYLFSVMAINIYHHFGGKINEQKFVLSLLWKPEVQNQSDGFAWLPFRGSGGDSIACFFQFMMTVNNPWGALSLQCLPLWPYCLLLFYVPLVKMIVNGCALVV